MTIHTLPAANWTSALDTIIDYDLLIQRMALTGDRQGPVLLVLNQLPKEFGEQIARHWHLGEATAQRGLQRGRPVLVDFTRLAVWDELPMF